MASGGVLQFSGTTYKHYLDTHPNTGPHNVQISTRVKSLNALFATTIPLQLLAYHIADLKGTDVDQPRNLAKSVTVE